MESHNAAVKRISARVKEFHSQKKPFRIYHGSTNTTRRRSGPSPDTTIDISTLKNVLSVSADGNIALVEPNVPMDAFVSKTLKHGLVSPVVMEFPGITVGGAFAGTGGESSSFRWGTFDRIVSRIEIVLGNGEVVWASDEDRADLLDGSAGAFGTLGVLTLLEVRLVPAKSKLVQLQYHPFQSAAEATVKFREFCKQDAGWDYVDGIMYGRSSGVVITGSLLDGDTQTLPKATARYSRAIDNWYSADVQRKLEACPEGWIDIVPIEDYLFRYDRGAFWCGRHTFDFLGLPFNGATRWLLDGFMHTRDLFSALHATGSMIKTIIQDLCIPAENLSIFVTYTTLELGIWPLWLCPMRPNAGRGFFQLSPTCTNGADAGEAGGSMWAVTDSLWLNVGLWGGAPSGAEEAVEVNRRLEQMVRALGGYKWLYAQTFYTEDEFWSIYPRAAYDSLRNKYHATSLPSAYDKVKTDVETEKRQMGGWTATWLYDASIGGFGSMIGWLGRGWR
jgi:FAD/FMN-containing dehydrogenase